MTTQVVSPNSILVGSYFINQVGYWDTVPISPFDNQTEQQLTFSHSSGGGGSGGDGSGGFLIAVRGDEETHGGGPLDTNVGDNTLFISGKNIVVIGDHGTSGDPVPHTPTEVTATGSSSTLYAYGVKVHRHGDARACGATTIVTGQTTAYSG